MSSLRVKDFNLKHTLECGQFFRFYKKDSWYYVNSRNRFFRVKQEGDRIHYEGVGGAFIRKFFSLDVDYTAVLNELSKDRHLKKAIEKYRGLRLIRQDPWECTVSYICSAAANIPKIKMNVNLLSKKYGKPLCVENECSFSFPVPGSMKNLCDVKEAKTGFRAKYICEINARVDDDFFKGLKLLDYSKAKQKLTQLSGVGEKIADCILLFAYSKGEAFPVDTWIRKQMQMLYFKGIDVSDDEIRNYAVKKWKQNAGIAQQYLYHYGRMN